MLGAAFFLCPCHLPIYLALLGGTAAGALLSENAYTAGAVLALAAPVLPGLFTTDPTVQAAATDGAGLYNPLSFAIVGESLPGSGFSGTIDSGSAVRIMTGAPVPSGATCVVPAEHASETDDRVEINVGAGFRCGLGGGIGRGLRLRVARSVRCPSLGPGVGRVSDSNPLRGCGVLGGGVGPADVRRPRRG